MQRSEMDPDEGGPGGSPRTSDRPPVGEPLVVSKRRPVQPAAEPEPPPPPPGPLAGRVGLVTGATGDLGSAFAGALGERGARVCLLDADLDALRSSAARVGAGDPPLVLRCDLGSADDVRSVCDFLRRSGARLDLVVHAATAPQDGTVLDSPVDGLDEHYLIEVRAPSILAQELADALAPGASVVFVDREPGHADAGAGAQRSVLAAARRGLVDVLRAELGDGDVRLVSASCAGDSVASDVAEVVLDAVFRTGPGRVTDLRVLSLPPAEPVT